MEALTSMTVATLAVIDMAKGVDRSALAPGPGPGRLPRVRTQGPRFTKDESHTTA